MEIHITLKNYRCFPRAKPARITLRKGSTAFVGINNSGKSSLLKFFYEARNLFNALASPAGNWVTMLQGRDHGCNFSSSVTDPDEVFSKSEGDELSVGVSLHSEGLTSKDPPILTRACLHTQRGSGCNWQGEFFFADAGLANVPQDEPLGLNGTVFYRKDKPFADSAPLCRAFETLSKSIYIGAFRNAINMGATTSYFDIDVGQAFIKRWKEYLTGPMRKHNEAAHRLTEDIRKIFRFDQLQINPSADDQTLQVFINGRSFRLEELGSGLAQFILVLANAAIKDPTFILIDEPELSLHPALQLDFMTTLGSYAREGILFATHSIGLARASADSIYSLRKAGEGETEVRSFDATPRLSELLGELSFSGYRELGVDKVLFVEGVTDVKTVQQFLRRYRKDHLVLLLPLGGLVDGSRGAELQEVKRISENVFALIDVNVMPRGRSWIAIGKPSSLNARRRG